MREVKHIGKVKRGNDSQNYRYSVFECPSCLAHVEKKTKDGLKANFCSHKCYAANRKNRGAYKDSVMISGYRYILKSDHPHSTLKGYVAEHRLVAENSIGRLLREGEDVHHINEIKTDNRPSNLMVLSKSDHMKLHKKGATRDEFGKFAIKV